VGSAASTLAAHVSVLLWRLADAGSDPCFEIGVPRSYAGYIYEALAHAATTTR
jgi:sarcosine oxidase gamma subunit